MVFFFSLSASDQIKSKMADESKKRSPPSPPTHLDVIKGFAYELALQHTRDIFFNADITHESLKLAGTEKFGKNFNTRTERLKELQGLNKKTIALARLVDMYLKSLLEFGNGQSPQEWLEEQKHKKRKRDHGSDEESSP